MDPEAQGVELKEGPRLALDPGSRPPPDSCHLLWAFPCCFPPDAEPRVTLHSHQSPEPCRRCCRSSRDCRPCRPRPPRAGTQVRAGAGGQQGSGSSSLKPFPAALSSPCVPEDLFSCFFQLLFLLDLAFLPFLRGQHLPLLGLSCLQPWLFGMARPPASSAGSTRVCARGAHPSPALPVTSSPAGASSAQQQLMQQMIQLLAEAEVHRYGGKDWC